MNLQEFKQLGVSIDDEIDIVDILGSEALTTRQVAEKFTTSLPVGSASVTVSNARQKLVRAEKQEKVIRKRVNGVWHWCYNDKESKESYKIN